MDEKTLLEAIGKMIDSKLETVKSNMSQMMDSKFAVEHENTRTMLQEELKTIKEDLEIIKEEATITRHTGNILLKWAEKADRTSVNVGLYDDDIKD